MPVFVHMTVVLCLLMTFGCNRKGNSKGGGQLVGNPDETGMCSVLGTADPGERYELKDEKDAQNVLIAVGPSASVGHTPSYWDVGQTVSVCFLADSKGTESLKTRIFEIASEWSKVANLTLDRVSTCTSADSADIKIRLGDNISGDTGSWSYIGQVSKSKFPSMNLGWAAQSNLSLKSLRRVVLHEFGHAIGLQHEQLNPNAAIPWDKPKVYQYYKDCCGWSQADVDHNVFRPLDASDNQALSYDRFSIMHYMVPKTLLTDPTFEVKNNTELSNGDKLWAAIAYPRATITRDTAQKIYDAYLTEGGGGLPQFNWFQENRFPPVGATDWSTRTESYSSSHPYANNTSTTKTFEVQDQAVKFVRARFSRVETEESYDFLSFLKSDGTFLDRFSGVANDFLSPAVPGNKMQIQFTSDSSSTSFGFEMKSLEYTTKEIRLLGCTDEQAANFEPTAKVDDGSCQAKPADTTLPTPGSVSLAELTANGVKVAWTPATDDRSGQANLQYLLFFKKDSAPTRDEALASGSFSAGLSSQNLTDLEAGATYHILLLVKDEAGNIAEYGRQSLTTLQAGASEQDVATCNGAELTTVEYTTTSRWRITITRTLASPEACIAERDAFNQRVAAATP